jgi:antirestriction protein ArdC
MTFKQAPELNACVRKGEKGSLAVYANSITKTVAKDAGEDVEREIHFLKATRCSMSSRSRSCPSSIT